MMEVYMEVQAAIVQKRIEEMNQATIEANKQQANEQQQESEQPQKNKEQQLNVETVK